MEKNMSPSNKGLSRGLIGKLLEMLGHGLDKSTVFNNTPTAEVDRFVKEAGPNWRDASVELLGKLFRAFIGIVTPVRALDTGLVPNGWSVESDNPEGDINLANLDYSTCPVQGGDGGYVGGDTMLARAGNAYGSLGFAAALLKAQAGGKEIFPVESRGKHYFIMPRTILLGDDRRRRVACFRWLGRQWALRFSCLDSDFDGRDRFVRPRELCSAA